MAQHVAADKRRISYFEYVDSYERLERLAESTDMTVSDHIRNATYLYAKSQESLATEATDDAKLTSAR